jgi:putative transposase
MSGNDFDKYVNRILSEKEEYMWIKLAGSKARKKAIKNAEAAYKKFFEGSSGFPKFKKKRNQDVKAYFPKNNPTDLVVERHRIKIPTFGFVRLKEKSYIPQGVKVWSCTVSQKADRYYVSVLVEIPPKLIKQHNERIGTGVDLGVKDFAAASNGKIYKNINKSRKVRRLKRQLKHHQRHLSRKYKHRKKSKRKEKATKNIRKQLIKVQKLHQKLTNIRHNYISNVVISLVKAKPEYITIENLNVKGMMKNKHLARSIAEQNFHKFKSILTSKCKDYNIELRMVDRWYPSSKMCHLCGNIKKDLKLSDRKYICKKCGLEIDRDLNAAINLALAKTYEIVT